MTGKGRTDKPIRVLNACALDRLGGVERRLPAYLEYSQASGAIEHHVLLLGNPCHPYVRSRLYAASRSVSYVKFRKGLKVPRWPAWLRRLNQAHAVRKVSPHVILIWDKLTRIAGQLRAAFPQAATVYYDCGESHKEQNEESMDALKSFDAAICVSNASRRMLELRWKYSGPTHICLNALRPDVAPEAPVARRIREGSVIRLGMAGRLMPRKGACLAVSAVRKINDEGHRCELYFAGGATEEENLRVLARELGVEARVHSLGERKDMADFYRRIEILLCPSIFDPCPNVCIEAAAFGCVVLGSCVDGIPEVVAHGRTGLCLPPTLPASEYPGLGGTLEGLPESVYDPATDSLMPPRLVDPASVARAVAGLVEEPGLFERLSTAAINEVSSRFRFDSHVSCIDGFLREISETNAASRTAGRTPCLRAGLRP